MKAGKTRVFLRAAGLMVVFAALVAVGLLTMAWDAMGAAPSGARRLRMLESPQHQGERFTNRMPEKMPELWALAGRYWRGTANERPSLPPPVQVRQASDFPALAGVLAVTWLGHSSLLFEIDGTVVLTDPVFSERTSPLQFLGPKRFHAPPLGVEDLPEVDLVVISHDHYDHLDRDSIIALNRRSTRFLVPLGVGAHLAFWGVPEAQIEELDWWQETAVGGLRVVCTPARHFSGRGLTDRNRTLWSSWVMLSEHQRVYFSGDTAMSEDFAEIGRRFGPFDLTAMEVGAYDRGWPDVHLGPEQAVQAHRELRGSLMLPVHWGTFDLALHSWTEPVERLRVAARSVGVTLLVPQVGQRIDAANPPPIVPWWPRIPWQTAAEHPVVSSPASP